MFSVFVCKSWKAHNTYQASHFVIQYASVAPNCVTQSISVATLCGAPSVSLAPHPITHTMLVATNKRLETLTWFGWYNVLVVRIQNLWKMEEEKLFPDHLTSLFWSKLLQNTISGNASNQFKVEIYWVKRFYSPGTISISLLHLMNRHSLLCSKSPDTTFTCPSYSSP